MTLLPVLIAAVVKYAVLLGFTMTLVPLLTWMERRQSAMMQDRVGPNRADIFGVRAWGLFHPIADGIKLLMKEDFIPGRAHRALFTLAPVLALAPVLIVIAVIPFGPDLCVSQLREVAPQCAPAAPEHLQVATLDVGILFVFAIMSLSAYGATLAGWSSYNKWGLLGGLRASAQMISYEVTMGLAIVGALLVYGTLEPGGIVQAQIHGHWGVVTQPLGFLLFFTAAIAESKRAPFDLPEGESEIIGYFVEYSGMRFGMFYMGEFAEVVVASMILTTLFFGGWELPLVTNTVTAHAPHWAAVVFGFAVFGAKTFLLCALQLAVRWTLPRLRYDQLMRLGWKGLLPASLVNLVATACVLIWVP